MAVATLTFTSNGYPRGNDNTQRHQNQIGLVTVVGASPSYVQGGIRINFNALEALKLSPDYTVPVWADIVSFTGSGYVYVFAPNGPVITNLALTSNVVTITAKNNLATGDVVKLSGLTTTAGLNGVSLTVISTGLSATQFEANFTHGNISSAAETGFATPTSYASGLPYQGNVMILESAGSAAPQVELSTTSLPAGVTGDTIAFRAEFVRGG